MMGKIRKEGERRRAEGEKKRRRVGFRLRT
jgi:hypothetical protein